VADKLNLSNLKPADKRRARKRIGRGQGSGKGRYSGRGIKGQKSRSGSHKLRPGFEGGQTPLYMRLGKQPGNTSKDAMPIGPFRTQTIPVNVSALERFDNGTEVTVDLLLESRIVRKRGIDVKILGHGELTKQLTVIAHRFSTSAREKIEAAGGSVVPLREEVEKKSRKPKRGSSDKQAPEPEPEAASEAEPSAESEADDAGSEADEASEA
jgi:large subunit ribosomal protein L15